MAYSQSAEVKMAQQLQGKSNFITWTREFDRAAKAADVFKLFHGQEMKLKDEPEPEEYLVFNDSAEATLPSTVTTRSRAAQETDSTSTVDSARSLLAWQAALKKWERYQAKSRTAMDLLLRWVSPGIVIDIEDIDDPIEAYNHIKGQYAITNHRAREQTLAKITALSLTTSDTMTDYLNQHRQHRADLKKLEYSYSDDQMVSNILIGLPSSYRNFKKQYDWIRAKNPDEEHDLSFLFDRLFIEEEDQENQKKERKAKQKDAEPKDKGKNTTKSQDDRSNLKCSGCNKWGHLEEGCWTTHPELKPKNVRDRENRDPPKEKNKAATASYTQSKTPRHTAALAEADVDNFKVNLMNAAQGTTPTSTTITHPADDITQTTISSLVVMEQHGQDVVSDKIGIASHLKPQSQQSAITALVVGNFETQDTWLIDSGANMHITNNKKWFTQLYPLNVQIKTADGATSLDIHGGGTVKLALQKPNGETTTFSFSDVAYAPNGRCNLLSLHIFLSTTQTQAKFTVDKVIFHDVVLGEIASAEQKDGLYYLSLGPTISTHVQSALLSQVEEGPLPTVLNPNDPVWMWHRRLGHLSLQNMRNLLKLSDGINVTDKQIQAKLKMICPICATTRALVKIPRDPAKRHAQNPGQLMHVDAWGPYSIKGFDGTCFFLFFTDDATRFTWAERFSAKNELSTVFKRLHAYIERSHGITIRVYRFDNEFSQGPIGQWCTKKGIGLEATTPHDHYQNGVGERTNRTIREKAAPLIQETSIGGQVKAIVSNKGQELLRTSTIPESLWPEAIEHAVWLKNRSPSRALQKKEAKTPWDAMYKNQPSFARERIWGSRTYVSHPPEKRQGQPK